MPLRVGDICYNIMKCNCVKLKIKTGKARLDRFVWRAISAEHKNEADLAEPYDVAFVSGKYGDALSLAAKVLERGVGAMVLNNGTCSNDTKDRIAALCTEADVPLIEIEEYACFSVAKALFEKEIDAFETKRVKLHCELQNMLIFRDNPHRCAAMLETYGSRCDGGFCVAVLNFVSKDGTLPDNQMLSKAERLAEIGMSEVTDGAAAVLVGSRIALVFNGKAQETVRKATEAALAAIPAELTHLFGIYVGTGRHCCGIAQLSESFATASRAADIQGVRGRERAVLSYEELGISKLLMKVDRGNDMVNDFYRETIGPLVEYDRRNGTDFVNFLMVYFEYGGHVRQIGEALYLHRNSVNYRLNKIEQIVGRDLSDICDRSEMLVALRLFELTEGEDDL